MNVINDVRELSDKAIDKLAEAWGDLPRPVLATIGVGDAALEKLADLRRRELVRDMERFLADLPNRAQQLFADLPAKAQEAANALRPDHLRETVEDYRSTVADTYGDLAQRGSATVARARAARHRDADDSRVTVTNVEVVDVPDPDAAAAENPDDASRID